MDGYSVPLDRQESAGKPPPGAAPASGDAEAVFAASLLYAVGDLHRLARSAPPETAEVIHAAASLLASLVTAKD